MNTIEKSPVQVTAYRQEYAEHPQFLLICPHDDDGKEFLEQYPDTISACPADEEVLQKYVRLEQDFGTAELAHSIAEILASECQLRGDVLKVAAIESYIPHGMGAYANVATYRIATSFS